MNKNKPVIREDRVIKHNLFQELNEFIWQISSHEGFHCHRDIFRVLCF